MAIYNQVLIIYGSETGNTERAAEIMASVLNRQEGIQAETMNVGDLRVEEKLKNAKAVLMGASTWDHGLPQDDFKSFMEDVDPALIKPLEVGVFGFGDPEGFPEAFCGATDVIRGWLKDVGATVVGDNLRLGADADDVRNDLETFALRYVGIATDLDPTHVIN